MSHKTVKRNQAQIVDVSQSAISARRAISINAFSGGLVSALARRSFAYYCRLAWETADNGRSVHWNWHIGVIAEHLQALYERRLKGRRLGVNLPPGMGKSLIVSVLWPSWLWLHDPSLRILVVSANSDVLLRDSMKMHDLIDSDWYQTTFAPRWTFSATQDAKEYYQNTAGGSRLVRTTGQRITGARADVVVIDDPTDAAQAYSDKAALPAAIRYYTAVLSSRAHKDALWALIMQRLHPEDLSGHLRKAESERWDWVILPNEYIPEAVEPSSLGEYDPRKVAGELLFPWLLDKKTTKEIKETDIVEYETQYQQQATAKGIGVINVDSFRFWSPRTLPERFSRVVVSADLTAKTKGTRNRDWAVLQIWGEALQEYYLLDQSREKTFSLAGIVGKMVSWVQRRKEISELLIETKALGKEAIHLLKKTLIEKGIDWVRVIPVDPQGTSKRERWDLVDGLLRDGKVYLPDPRRYIWVETVFLREFRAFPFGAHDDQVDAASQALIYLSKKSGQQDKRRVGFSLSAAMKEARKR